MTEVTAGSELPGPGVAGESALRVCKRPGCGNPVPSLKDLRWALI